MTMLCGLKARANDSASATRVGISWSTRMMAKALGSVPEASFGDALHHFQEADDLNVRLPCGRRELRGCSQLFVCGCGCVLLCGCVAGCVCMVARGPVVPRRHLTGQVDYERVLARPYVGENGQEVQGTSGTATCCLLACRDGRRQKQCGQGERRPAQLVEMLRAFCGQC